jgi:hypothetical protein
MGGVGMIDVPGSQEGGRGGQPLQKCECEQGEFGSEYALRHASPFSCSAGEGLGMKVHLSPQAF